MRNPILPFVDSTFLRMAEYEQLPHLQPARDALRERKYTVSSTGVTARVMSHWKDLGLLPEGVANEGWKKFTLVEIVWLEAIQRMRDFGLPLEAIREARENVLQWDEVEEHYPIFEFYLSQAWFTEEDTYIVIVKGGSDIGSSQDIERAKLISGSRHMLLISLKVLLSGLGYTVKRPDNLVSLAPDEKRALAAIRFYGADKVMLKMDGRRVAEIEHSKVLSELPHNFEIDEDFKLDSVYGSVETQYENGKRRSVRVTKRERTDPATGKDRSD